MDVIYLVSKNNSHRSKLAKTPHKFKSVFLSPDCHELGYVDTSSGIDKLVMQNLKTGHRIDLKSGVAELEGAIFNGVGVQIRFKNGEVETFSYQRPITQVTFTNSPNL